MEGLPYQISGTANLTLALCCHVPNHPLHNTLRNADSSNFTFDTFIFVFFVTMRWHNQCPHNFHPQPNVSSWSLPSCGVRACESPPKRGPVRNTIETVDVCTTRREVYCQSSLSALLTTIACLSHRSDPYLEAF
jgi:hypothetical protein